MIRKTGTIVLVLGVVGTLYGAVGFFIDTSLPPNGGNNGRLPSLYLLLAGMGLMLVGLVIRGLRFGNTSG